jgi:ribosome-binding protein aMBF1 (putative translation factor)
LHYELWGYYDAEIALPGKTQYQIISVMKKYDGTVIVKKRQKLGIKQEELSFLIGKSVKQLNLYEHSRAEPKATALFQLAIILRCSMDDFFR